VTSLFDTPASHGVTTGEVSGYQLLCQITMAMEVV